MLGRSWGLRLVGAAWRGTNPGFAVVQAAAFLPPQGGGAALSPAFTVPRGGRRAACGRPSGERRGRHELAVCLHLSLLRGTGSGAEPWEVQAGSQRKRAISSRLCRVIRGVGTGCLVSYRSFPEVVGMGRRRDRLCGFFNLVVSLPLSSTCMQVRA